MATKLEKEQDGFEETGEAESSPQQVKRGELTEDVGLAAREEEREEYDQYNDDPTFNNRQREYYNQRLGGMRNRRGLEQQQQQQQHGGQQQQQLHALQQQQHIPVRQEQLQKQRSFEKPVNKRMEVDQLWPHETQSERGYPRDSGSEHGGLWQEGPGSDRGPRWEEHERLRWEDPMSEVEWGGGREPGAGLRGHNHDRHRKLPPTPRKPSTLGCQIPVGLGQLGQQGSTSQLLVANVNQIGENYSYLAKCIYDHITFKEDKGR